MIGIKKVPKPILLYLVVYCTHLMLLINSTSLGVSIANLWGSCQFSSKASVRFSKFCCHWIELFRLYPRTCWWFFWPCAFWIYPPVPSSTHQIPGCWWWSSLASWRDSSSAASKTARGTPQVGWGWLPVLFVTHLVLGNPDLYVEG